MTTMMEHLAETSEYSYELSEEEVKRLTAELLHDREPVTNDRFACYEVRGDAPAANLGRQVERVVFEKYFKNDAQKMHEEYGKYENDSTFFIVIDTKPGEDGEEAPPVPVGAVRVISEGRDGARSFKSINDVVERFTKYNESTESLEKYPYTQEEVLATYGIDDLSECWDIATAAVMSGYGGGEVSSRMYRAMYVASQRKGIKHYFSIIDEKPFSLMEYVGFPFEKLHEADWMPYIDSAASLPVYGHAPNFQDAVLEKEANTSAEELAIEEIALPFQILGHGSEDNSFNIR